MTYNYFHVFDIESMYVYVLTYRLTILVELDMYVRLDPHQIMI